MDDIDLIDLSRDEPRDLLGERPYVLGIGTETDRSKGWSIAYV
jgi:hypothetical protein